LIKLGNITAGIDAGQKLFIDQMEAMMERYRIFMKRFELSRRLHGSDDCKSSSKLNGRI